MSSRLIPVSSLLRIPHPYSSSRINRSRSAKAVSSGIFASSTRFISSIVGTRGNRFGSFGAATSSAGFDSIIRSRPIHLKNERIDDSARATVALLTPRSYNCPI